MGRIQYFVDKHPDLFTYLPAEEVHPHDRFLDRVLLRHLPDNITPNRLTFFRILATPVVFFLILFQWYVVGMIAFLLTAFTDAMDGSLARTRNQITRFGMLFDPLADKFLVGSLVLLLVFQHYDMRLGLMVLGVEIVFIATALVAKYKFKTIRMANVWGKIKMILQVLALFVTLLAILFNFPTLFTIGAWLFGLAIGFAVVSLFAHGI